MSLISSLTEELYRTFYILNEKYFYNKLPTPIITIQKDKPHIYGYFMTKPTWYSELNNQKYYEININPLGLDRDINEIVAVLLHEMVHYYNELENINDCTKSGKHNKKFKESAERVDLIVDEDNYGTTYASDKLKDFIKNELQPNVDCFKLYMITEIEDEQPQKPKKKTQFKYICPKCGMVAKAKAELNIICGACQVELEMEDIEEEINNEDC